MSRSLSLCMAIVAFTPLSGQVQPVLRELGIEFTEKADAPSAVEFSLNGRRITMAAEAGELQFRACIDPKPDLMKANLWSRTHFFTRAYIDEQRCAGLASDIALNGAVTKAMMAEDVREFMTNVTVYARFAAEPQPPAMRSPVGPMAWSQEGIPASYKPPWIGLARATPGLLTVGRRLSLKFDSAKWRMDETFALEHASGNAHAVVSWEPVAVPGDALETVALANAQAADPNAKVVFRNHRWVKGVDFWYVKIEAGIGGVPMIYYGGYCATPHGTVQVVASTTKDRAADYDSDFMDLLNGLGIAESAQ